MQVLKFSLADCHTVVCVSHTSKENTVLRACVPPQRVCVIPNGAHAAAPGVRKSNIPQMGDVYSHQVVKKGPGRSAASEISVVIRALLIMGLLVSHNKIPERDGPRPNDWINVP